MINTVKAVMFLLAPDQPKAAEGQCWRCNGIGEVLAYDDTMTPCGACLGTKVPPTPCPECGSPKVKIRIEMGSQACCWWCRDCGHRGPSRLVDMEAMNAWNTEAREAACPTSK